LKSKPKKKFYIQFTRTEYITHEIPFEYEDIEEANIFAEKSMQSAFEENCGCYHSCDFVKNRIGNIDEDYEFEVLEL
tara:strand:+ start:335 stop:565 length:231 start_codon:yes stop_codon:yes gene_type:complete